VPEHQLEEALDGARLGLPDVLDLLGHVLQVEFVRQVAAGFAETAQGRRLFLRPGVDIIVVGCPAAHEDSLAEDFLRCASRAEYARRATA
jgi:hypothetical protein